MSDLPPVILPVEVELDATSLQRVVQELNQALEAATGGTDGSAGALGNLFDAGGLDGFVAAVERARATYAQLGEAGKLAGDEIATSLDRQISSLESVVGIAEKAAQSQSQTSDARLGQIEKETSAEAARAEAAKAASDAEAAYVAERTARFERQAELVRTRTEEEVLQAQAARIAGYEEERLANMRIANEAVLLQSIEARKKAIEDIDVLQREAVDERIRDRFNVDPQYPLGEGLSRAGVVFGDLAKLATRIEGEAAPNLDPEAFRALEQYLNSIFESQAAFEQQFITGNEQDEAILTSFGQGYEGRKIRYDEGLLDTDAFQASRGIGVEEPGIFSGPLAGNIGKLLSGRGGFSSFGKLAGAAGVIGGGLNFIGDIAEAIERQLAETVDRINEDIERIDADPFEQFSAQVAESTVDDFARAEQGFGDFISAVGEGTGELIKTIPIIGGALAQIGSLVDSFTTTPEELNDFQIFAALEASGVESNALDATGTLDQRTATNLAEINALEEQRNGLANIQKDIVDERIKRLEEENTAIEASLVIEQQKLDVLTQSVETSLEAAAAEEELREQLQELVEEGVSTDEIRNQLGAEWLQQFGDVSSLQAEIVSQKLEQLAIDQQILEITERIAGNIDREANAQSEVEAIFATRIAQLRLEAGIKDDISTFDLNALQVEEILLEVKEEAAAAGLNELETADLFLRKALEINSAIEQRRIAQNDALLAAEILDEAYVDQAESIGAGTRALAEQQALLLEIGQQLQDDIVGALDIDVNNGINDTAEAIKNVRDATEEAADKVLTLRERFEASIKATELGLDALSEQFINGNADGLLDDFLNGEGNTTPEQIQELNDALQQAADLELALGVFVEPTAVEEAFAEIERRVAEFTETEEAKVDIEPQLLRYVDQEVDPVIQAALAGDNIRALALLAAEELAAAAEESDGLDLSKVIFRDPTEDAATYADTVWDAITKRFEERGSPFDSLFETTSNVETDPLFSSQFGGADGGADAEGGFGFAIGLAAAQVAATASVQETILASVEDIGPALNDAVVVSINENADFSAAQEILGAEGDALAAALVDGVTTGIADRIPEAVGTTNTLADAVSAAARKAWSIDSPSKVFQTFGQEIIAGLVAGLDEDDALKRSRELAGEITSTFESVGNSIKSAISGSVTGATEDEDGNPVSGLTNTINALRTALSEVDDPLEIFEQRARAIARLQQFGDTPLFEEQVRSGQADVLLTEIIDNPLGANFDSYERELERATALADEYLNFEAEVEFTVDQTSLDDLSTKVSEAIQFSVTANSVRTGAQDQIPAEWGWTGWKPGEGQLLLAGESWLGPETVIGGYHPQESIIQGLKDVDAYEKVRQHFEANVTVSPSFNVLADLPPELSSTLRELRRSFSDATLGDVLQELRVNQDMTLAVTNRGRF